MMMKLVTFYHPDRHPMLRKINAYGNFGFLKNFSANASACKSITANWIKTCQAITACVLCACGFYVYENERAEEIENRIFTGIVSHLYM